MNITHYKGRKIPIVLVPYCIKTDREINDPITTGIKNIPFNLLTNYQSMSSIVYPDTLFFYDMINSNSITNSTYSLNDIFYSFSDSVNNRSVIENLKNSISNEQCNTYQKNAADKFKEEFKDLNTKYSMIELFMLLSNGLVFEWCDDALYILETNPERIYGEEITLDGILSKDIKKCHNYIPNIERFWSALQERISYKDLITSNLVRYYVDACQYDSNMAIAL